ncbi:redoxin domain-containing protein [Maribacter sp. 2210JD10-5]|uniref:redoxin domain-containing protein n=1 Tax=Maribacter sp. 2210JD10-5 TaxID=3386272 RepID=UPI0039BC8DAB
MRNLVSSLMVVLLLAGCNSNPEGFTIEGNLRGELEEGTMVFLKKIGDNNQPIEVDTASLTGGKFTFTGTAPSPELHYIFLDKSQGYTAVILENGTIEFNAQKDSLGFATVEGTLQNDIFAKYMKQSRELSQQAQSIQEDMKNAMGSAEQTTALRDEMKELQEEYKTFELDYIKNNPNALISALLLDRALATKAIATDEVKAMYDSLTPEIQNSKPGKRILENLEKMKKVEEAEKKTSIGAKAPNFSGPNPEGGTTALSDVLGKATLIDFWAAWCRPCRAENPNVLAVYNKYHDKGLNIIGVSLDKTEDAWKKAISDDGLPWNQVSNLSYFNDEIAQLYGVNAIPAAFLLDENGVIVAKNLRGPDLEAKVAELLN